jgi:outer membrane receptor protein involved in Fe transport
MAGYSSSEGWEVQGYVRNATDKRYIATAQGGATAPGTYLLGAPRQFGVRLSYRFE